MRRWCVQCEYFIHRWSPQWLVALLLTQVFLLGVAADRHGPVVDELGHFPSGLSHWRFGEFDLYRVNPPLVRMIATIPVVLQNKCCEVWDHYTHRPFQREEFAVGRSFVSANGADFFRYITMARLACLPLSLIGTYVCYGWAKDLSGRRAGVFAAMLYVFSPNMLAHGSLMTPDAGASALGLLAAWKFWRWLRCPTRSAAVVAGMSLGLAELTKSTWIILFLIWPAVFLIVRQYYKAAGRFSRQHSVQLLLVLGIGCYLLNAGYFFRGSLKPLGEFRFSSECLTGDRTPGGNQFVGTPLHHLPVPLPEDYLLGIDQQKLDFEAGQLSWLAGQWRNHGWWYYYLYALLVKSPLGYLCLAAGTLLTIPRMIKTYRAPENLLLILPAAVIVVLVSSQTGFNKHLRYILPAMPFAYVLIGCAWVKCFARRFWVMRPVGLGLLIWGSLSSLSVWPLSLTYFNELVGGAEYGDRHLLGSNLDWGQGVRSLQKWDASRADDRQLFVACDGLYDPAEVGIRCRPVPVQDKPLPPGWYAISINRIHDTKALSDLFAHRTPDFVIDNCIRVFLVESGP